MTSNDRGCFNIDSICGYSLPCCVVFVGVATMIISFAAMVASYGSIKSRNEESSYNTKPLTAMNMIFSFACISISFYQFLISALLAWFKSSTYVCSLWFVSHLSILTMFFILFSARTVVCIKVLQYNAAAINILACIIYEGVLLFFVIVVHSYMRSPVDSLEPIYY